MIRSRRAINKGKSLFLITAWIFLICALVLPGWLWLQARNKLNSNGAALVQQRMGAVLGKSVSLTAASLSFPNHLLIKDLSIFDKEGSLTLLQSPRLEIDFSLVSILTGTIRPKKISFIAPKLDITNNETTPMSERLKKALPKTTIATVPEDTSWYYRLKPSSWPIEINPNHVEIIGCQAHIEDEQDILPTIDGRFSLTFTRSPDPQNLSLELASLDLNEVKIFYHGLQGTLTGKVQADRDDATAQLSFHLPRQEELEFVAKMDNYQRNANISFEIKTHSFDLKNLAMIKYPLAQLSPSTNITGSFTSSSPVLYGKPFDSFSASVLFNQGNWRIDAISLKLKEANGEITGSIIPEPAQESSNAKANLFYQGTILPDFKFSGDLLNTLPPILWQKPYTANTEMTLDLSSYPLQATEIKLTSSHGDLFAKGVIDLFSGYANMTGTFLKPAKPQEAGEDAGNTGPDAFTLTISGPLTNPELSGPPSAPEQP